MKLLKSNGRYLEVYDIKQPLMKITMINVPLKENGYQIVSDDIARDKVRSLIDLDVYHIKAYR